MTKKVLLFVISLLGLSASSLKAQLYFGVANSNYSGIDAMYLNPANTADSRHRFSFELFSLDVTANNTEEKFNFRQLIKDGIKSNNVQLGNYFKNITTSSVDMVLPFTELRGPSMYYSINSKNTIGFNTRVRTFNQFENFQGSFFDALAHGVANTGTSFPVVDNTPYYWSSTLLSDFGLTYGVVLIDKGKSFLKAGISAKLYRGNAFVSMQGQTMNGDYFSNEDSLRMHSVDFILKSNVSDNKINQFKQYTSVSNFFDQFLGKSAGQGFGGDVGLVYEVRPDAEKYYYDMDNVKHIYDESKNKYKIKFTLSVLDIGMLKYKNVQEIHVTDSGSIGRGDHINVSDINDFKTQLRSFGFSVQDLPTSVQQVKLPTTLMAGVDYKFAERFYGNLTYLQGLTTSISTPGNYYYNQLTLTPRYESKRLDVGVPLTYNTTSKDFKAGLGIRAGFFTIGSDDLLGFVGSSSKGVNFYMGITANINFKKPKDSDGDLVSDKLDKCPFVKGVWEYKGCPIPDTDGDGILDVDDSCPTVPGSKTAHGCPDRDGDGIPDASDLCPDVFGLAQFQGCPDRDGDGIPDKDDSCPDVKGEARYHGCPDTDGDGIPDNIDKCPNEKGSIAMEGCPDTDGDGIPDNIDKCPTKPGPKSNNGCPVITEVVKKRLAFAATAIQFDFAKATIKPKSFKLLDEIVAILNEYSDYYMTIEGHTDNVGTAEKNLKLSKDRANSVRDYFISKGISADRLAADGFGLTRPVASNKTSAGRAKNRRVEMDLKLK